MGAAFPTSHWPGDRLLRHRRYGSVCSARRQGAGWCADTHV